MEVIVRFFLPTAKILQIKPLSGGLINQTYQVTVDQKSKQQCFILQQINKAVFTKPEQLIHNYHCVQHALISNNFPYAVSKLWANQEGQYLFPDETGPWRLTTFIPHSISYETPPAASFLYEAGKAYGVFQTALRCLTSSMLQETIPNFHHLPKRFQILQYWIKKAPTARLKKAQKVIKKIEQLYHRHSIDFSSLPLRIVHNDCKLSNLLFSMDGSKCVSVIDWDTIMPGYVVTDFGDMVRGMCNTASEDEADLSQVNFSLEAYRQVEKGYLDATSSWLYSQEREALPSGVIYIILEQAIRFLSDFLSGDIYYDISYPEHNYHRSLNQIKLLEDFIKHMKYSAL